MVKKIDKCLLIPIIILSLIGLLMVYSASNVVASYKYDDKAYFLKRQLIFAIIGFFCMICSIYLPCFIFASSVIMALTSLVLQPFSCTMHPYPGSYR